MKIAIASNIENGIGLMRDFELLREFLEGLGHSVRGLQYDAPVPFENPKFDLMISLETISRAFLPMAPRHWWFPNPEWTYRKDLELAGRCFSKIFCKTREGYRIFKEIFPDHTFYVGFLTRDQFDTTSEFLAWSEKDGTCFSPKERKKKFL